MAPAPGVVRLFSSSLMWLTLLTESMNRRRTNARMHFKATLNSLDLNGVETVVIRGFLIFEGRGKERMVKRAISVTRRLKTKL